MVEGQPLIQAVAGPRRQALDGEAIFAGARRAQPGGRAGKRSIDLSHRDPAAREQPAGAATGPGSYPHCD